MSDARVQEALDWLQANSVAKIREEMAPRYGTRKDDRA